MRTWWVQLEEGPAMLSVEGTMFGLEVVQCFSGAEVEGITLYQYLIYFKQSQYRSASSAGGT